MRLDARDLVVRERVLPALLLSGLVSVVALGWTVGPWLLGARPVWVSAAVSGLIGLPLGCVAAVLVRAQLRGLRSGHWTLRVGAAGLWLCPRSWLNAAPDREPAPWIRIPMEDLIGVSAGEQRAHAPDSDGGSAHSVERWLDLELARPVPEAVLQALEGERARRPGTRFHVYPLEARGERVLRVVWQSEGLYLAPARARVLSALPARVSVRETPSVQAPDTTKLSAPEAEVLARDLHRRGRTMEAVRLLRAHHAWSLGRASAWLRAGEGHAA